MQALSNTERRSPKHLRSLKHDSSLHYSNTDGLDIATPLNKDHSRIQPLGCPYSMGSSGMELDGDPTPQDIRTLHLSDAGQPPLLSPADPVPCGLTEWPLRNVQQQAKRARVESIIQDMAGSFSSSSSSSSSSHEPDIDGAAEEVQESTGLWEWSKGGPHELAQRGATGYRNLEDQVMGTQLQNFTVRRSRSSGGLRPRADWPRDSDKTKKEPPLEEPHSFDCDSTGRDHNDTFVDRNCGDDFGVPSGRIRACGRKRVTMVSATTNTPQQKKKPDIVNVLMADILKYELSRAVSVSVDSIFKSLPLLEPPTVGMEMTHAPLLDSHHGMPPRASPYENNISGAPLPEVQTEALSLVVQKPPPGRSNALPSQLGPPRQHHPKSEFYTFSHRTDLPSEDQASRPCLKGGGGMDQAMAFKNTSKADAAGGGAFMLSGSRTSSTKVRYKVNSRSVRGSQVARRFAMDPMFLEDMCIPLDVDVKSDGTQSMLMTNLFSLAGGLTTSHLKKAKLMFFYTRYPSSLVLKTFFHDVQFTRCITSQLIKWFSNFREFYYIQMEKQARQAVVRGVPHARALSVGRQSELFRALNMHYNKTSDFQVPERFLEVAEITLREFYTAVSLGKDSDPSWKKPIYKVICKLDSNVPEEFKSHYPD